MHVILNSKIVLIAEDEVLIRTSAMAALVDSGFGVLEATHADHALTFLHSHPRIHLLFTDIHMPGGTMNGLELAHHVHTTWPWIALLMVSGEAQPTHMPPGCRFLSKPYHLDHVVAHVRSLLPAD
ncbi:MAG: response regulator [Pseudomonadota bacterium]|nr:response regulator [Pseudomonadota bacterium]